MNLGSLCVCRLKQLGCCRARQRAARAGGLAREGCPRLQRTMFTMELRPSALQLRAGASPGAPQLCATDWLCVTTPNEVSASRGKAAWSVSGCQ